MWKKFFDSYYWVLPMGVGSSSIWFVLEMVLLFTERSSLYFILAAGTLGIFIGAMLFYDYLESKKPPD